MAMASAVAWLRDAHVAARFQRLCGKQRVAIDSNGASPNKPKAKAMQQNGGVHHRHNGKGSGYHGESGNGSTASEHGQAQNGNGTATAISNGAGNGKPANGNSGVGNAAQHISPQTGDKGTTKIVHNNPLLWAVFLVASTVAEEEFFIAFLPIMFWNYDFFIGRRVVLLWFVAEYSGTALKDVIRWERPSSDIVIREATDGHSKEYGMPSTHTTSGSIITMALVYFSSLRYEMDLLPAVAVAAVLITCMGLSRVYSGHHSFCDVLGALLLVTAVMVVGSVWVDTIDSILMTPSLLGPAASLAVGLVFILMYPHPPIMRETSKDMPIIVAVFLGFYIGLWMSVGVTNPRDNRHLEPYTFPSPGWPEIYAGVLRYVTGVFLLVVIRAVLKQLSLRFFSLFADKSKGPAKEQLLVVICYRLVTYGGTCMSCVALGPHWFRLLGVPTQEIV